MPRGKADFATMKPFGTEGQLRFSPVVNASNQEIADIKNMNPGGSMSPGLVDLGDGSEVRVTKGIEFDADLLVKELDGSLVIEKAMFQRAQVKQGLMGKQAMAQGPRPKPVSPKLTVNQPVSPKVQTAPSVNKPMKPVQVRGQSNPKVKELDNSILVTKGPIVSAIESLPAPLVRAGKSSARKIVKAEIKDELGEKGYRGNSSFVITKGFEAELVNKFPGQGLIHGAKRISSNVFRRRPSTKVPAPIGVLPTPTSKPKQVHIRTRPPEANVAPKTHTSPYQSPVEQARTRVEQSGGEILTTGHRRPSSYTPDRPSATQAKEVGRGAQMQEQLRATPSVNPPPKPVKPPPESDATKMVLNEKLKAQSGTQTQAQPTGQAAAPATQTAAIPEKHKWSTGTKVAAGALGAGALYGGYRLTRPSEPEYPEYEDLYARRGYSGNMVSKSTKEEGIGRQIYSAGAGMGVIPAVGLGVVGGDIANRLQDQRLKRGFSKTWDLLKKIKK